MSLMSRSEYIAKWGQTHGGYDANASFLARNWLGFAYTFTRPLIAMRLTPNAITFLGLLISAVALWPAAVGGRWAILTALLFLKSGLFDQLDGAVALMTDSSTKWGAVFDAVCDRISDGVFLVAFWLLGAPVWACVLAGALMMLHEYLRARAAAAGMNEIGVVTVWERPTRVIIAVMFSLAAGIFVGSADIWAREASFAWIVLGVIGLFQLTRVVRKELA